MLDNREIELNEDLPELEAVLERALHRESQGLPLSVIEELVLECYRTDQLDLAGFVTKGNQNGEPDFN